MQSDQQSGGTEQEAEQSQQSQVAEQKAEQIEKNKIIERSLIGGLATIAIILLIAVIILSMQAASPGPHFVPAPGPPARNVSGIVGGVREYITWI
jgi:Na+/glutamate symporter